MARRKGDFFIGVFSCLITLLCVSIIEGGGREEDITLVWATKLSPRGNHRQVARDLGLTSHGPVNEILDEYHEFRLSHDDHVMLRDALGSHTDVVDHIHSRMRDHSDVVWASLQYSLIRERRVYFNDPSFHLQWHLVNKQEKGHDINVTSVWEMGVAGRGVTIAIVDDGIEHENEELRDNYDPRGSYDFNDNDLDPSPDTTSLYNSHGTRCAGLVAAVDNNELCGVGVAYASYISGIRLLDGTITDLLEAKSLTYKVHINHIYSCSWGPTDDGQTVEAPGPLAQMALRLGTEKGRYGYGSIYVFASGNGGNKHDNCNFDGYANSIYTITIGAVDELDKKPYYSEDCSAKVAVTYSNGVRRHDRNIVTSDITRSGGCTTGFSGTSAAAPIAAGVIALALEVRPCLQWRDIYSIVIYTSIPIDFGEAEWSTNGVGLNHSHQHGFGVLDSFRLVMVAKVWPILPRVASWTSPVVMAAVALGSHWAESNVTVLKTDLADLVTLEHVTVTVTIDHTYRGAIIVDLRSPMGTLSHLATARPADASHDGLKSWSFMTVRCWGENPIGNWSLLVRDSINIGPSSDETRGTLVKWSLTLYGSNLTLHDVSSRMKLVTLAVNNGSEFMSAIPCGPRPDDYHDIVFPDHTLGSKVLQIISLLATVVVILLMVYLLIVYVIGKCVKRRGSGGNNYLSALPNVPLRRTSSGDNVEEEAILLMDMAHDETQQQ